MDAAWIFVVIAAVVVLVALMVYALPPRGRRPGESVESQPGTTPTSSGSLTRGFGYLQVAAGPTGRRGGVHSRLSRAIQRIDAVDPHANTRRIGEALMQAGFSDISPAAPPTPRAQPAVLWVDPPAEQPRDRT